MHLILLGDDASLFQAQVSLHLIGLAVLYLLELIDAPLGAQE